LDASRWDRAPSPLRADRAALGVSSLSGDDLSHRPPAVSDKTPLDSSATVPFSRSAASATSALESTLCLFRVFATSHPWLSAISGAGLSLNHPSVFGVHSISQGREVGPVNHRHAWSHRPTFQHRPGRFAFRVGSFRAYRLAPGRRMFRQTEGGALIDITVQVVFVTVTLFGIV
jgi:hypothetical protein